MRHAAFIALAAAVLVATATASLLSDHDSAPPPHWQDLAYHNRRLAHTKRRMAKIPPSVTATAQERLPQIQQAYNGPMCPLCLHATQAVVDIIADKKDKNITRDIIAFACHEVFKNDTKKAAMCDLIADVADDIALPAFDELDRLHWNISVSLCADIFHFCNESCCLTDRVPEQIRLSFATRQVLSPSSSYRVAWNTLANVADFAVRWRVAGTTAWQSNAADIVRTYAKGGWHGWNYGALMTNLALNTTYEYMIASAAHPEAASSIISFSTLPSDAGTTARPLRILAVADMGEHAVSTNTINRMAELVANGDADFLLHYGDLGYADGNEVDWDIFFRKVQPIASRIPYMTTPGNHECLWNFTAYRSRVFMPTDPDTLPEAMYYSFSVGPTEYLMMDSESWIDTPQVDAPQAAWAGRRLAAANAAHRFSIVTMHRPLYCTPCHGGTVDCGVYAQWIRDRLEDTFITHKVPLVTFGHLHNYERTYPVRHDVLSTMNLTNPTAPMYLVNGAAGNKEGQASFHTQHKPWSAVRSVDVGFVTMQVSVDEATHEGTLHGKFIKASDNTVADSWTLVKQV